MFVCRVFHRGEKMKSWVKAFTIIFVIIISGSFANATQPEVVLTNPANGAANIPCDTTVVSITFSEPMQTSYYSIGGNGTWSPYSISWSDDSRTIYLTRSSAQPLSPGTLVAFTLNPADMPNFRDLDGNFLPTYQFSFTIAQQCGELPYVVATFPPNGAEVELKDLSYISVTFNKPMQARSTTQGTNWVPSSQSWSADQKTFFITPTGPERPNPGSQVTITLNPNGYTPGFKDLDGNPLPAYTFSFTVAPDFQLQKIPADPGKGFHWPYYLSIPDALSQNTVLLVEPNNTGTWSDDPSMHDNAAHNLILNHSWFAVDLDVPLMVPTFPRPVTPQAPEPGGVYTHALDRYSLSLPTLPENLRRIDMQLINMIADARERLRNGGYNVDDKVFLMGFSASGAFVSRFTILHPEIVKAVASGSPGGWPAAPVSVWDGIPLRYPVGVADVEELVGTPFDLDTFKNVPMFIYVGDQDTNDALDIRGMPQENRDAICAMLNCSPNPYIANRWPISEAIYTSVGANADFHIYPGIAHHFSEEIWSDKKAFFEQHKTSSVQIHPDEGTYGTKITITGSNFGAQKGKVWIGENLLNMLEWSNSRIECRLGKAIPPGAYQMNVHPKGSGPVIAGGHFTVKDAEVHSVTPEGATSWDTVTVTGKFFGTKKGKVYLEYDESAAPVRKTCKVTWWFMDPVTGDSEIVFVVPRMLPRACYVVVEPFGAGPVGTEGFTVHSPEIISVQPGSGLPGDQITISGNYFGSKKPKVFLSYPVKGKPKNKSCSIVRWDDNEIVFVMPKLPAGDYDLIVVNGVGMDQWVEKLLIQ